jgi:hypothetical protein
LRSLTDAVQGGSIGRKASGIPPTEIADFAVVADVPQLIDRLHNGLDRHIGCKRLTCSTSARNHDRTGN